MAYGDSEIINCYNSYKNEAEDARRTRMQQNKENFDVYHLRQDFSHKLKGQSTDFLPKVATAVEQNANMVQQGLLDIGEWFDVNSQEGIDPDIMKIKPSTVKRILDRQLQKDGFVKKVGDALKLGMLGGLIIGKVNGKLVNKPKFINKKTKKDGVYTNNLVMRKDKCWQLSIELIRHEDYRPDPTGRGLYEMQDIYMDYHQVLQLADEDDTYDKKVIKDLGAYRDDQEQKKANETGQDVVGTNYRKQIKLTQIWGSLINSKGEIEHENIVCTIANDRYVIQKPIPNPYWHQESPFVVAPLLSVPHAVWPKAMMDAAVKLNISANEIFNLLVDSGIMSVFGIKQIRMDWLEDPSQVNDGVGQGDTLKVNSSCPPGMKVLESVYSGDQPQEALNILNLVNQESSSSMFTNEIRSGGADMKNVRATSVVENSQALNNMASGMIKNLEGDEGSGFMTRVLAKAWKVTAQNMTDLNDKEVQAILTKKLADELLAMGKEEIFAETVQSCKFKVYGVSAVMNKMKDFTKLTTMLQVVFSNPNLAEAFMKKYDSNKLITEILRALDIDAYKLEADEEAGGDLTSPQPPVASSQGPDLNSQIPQAGAAVNQGDQNLMAGSQPASPQSIAKMG